MLHDEATRSAVTPMAALHGFQLVYWWLTGCAIFQVHPEAVDGMEHVVAICSEPKVCQRVLESPDTVILQFKSAPVAATWLWRIHLAKQRMAALIPSSFISDELGGGGDVSKQQSAPSAPGALAAQAQPTDDSGPTPPATPSAGMSDFATAAKANPEDAIRARSSKESITGTFDIGAFQLWVSGRTVDIWWPAQDFTAGNPQKSSYPNEVPLIVIHGQVRWLSDLPLSLSAP